jgi:hypothetical protein
VFVPQGKLGHFEKLITEYVERKPDKNGKALDHQTLVDAISALRVATFDSLWTDEVAALPAVPGQSIWWEAWLPLGAHAERTMADFRTVAGMAGLRVSDRVLHFPERMVAQVHGTKNQLLQSSLVLNMIAELRRAKTTAEFFANLALDEQADWQGDLQRRLLPEPTGNAYVTLLDTGVNHGHPLLAPFVDDKDRHAVEPDWGPDDVNGHGSELAGLALLGDLTAALAEDAQLLVPHRLESVKVLRWPGDNGASHLVRLPQKRWPEWRSPTPSVGASLRWPCRPPTAVIAADPRLGQPRWIVWLATTKGRAPRGGSSCFVRATPTTTTPGLPTHTA